jgi:hypothetical protein
LHACELSLPGCFWFHHRINSGEVATHPPHGCESQGVSRPAGRRQVNRPGHTAGMMHVTGPDAASSPGCMGAFVRGCMSRVCIAKDCLCRKQHPVSPPVHGPAGGLLLKIVVLFGCVLHESIPYHMSSARVHIWYLSSHLHCYQPGSICCYM